MLEVFAYIQNHTKEMAQRYIVAVCRCQWPQVQVHACYRCQDVPGLVDANLQPWTADDSPRQSACQGLDPHHGGGTPGLGVLDSLQCPPEVPPQRIRAELHGAAWVPGEHV